METTMWDTPLAIIGMVLAGSGLVGSALVYLGITIGNLRAGNASAHKRIDRLEELLRQEFQGLRADLKGSIEHAWAHCPLAKEQHK